MIKSISTYLRMIKFSHTIFALPFALSAIILAMREFQVTWQLIFWIIIAMIGARSSAMGFNRLIDADFDAANPRTSNREIPSGHLSIDSVRLFVVIFSCLFIIAAAMINTLCLILSFPVLAILLLYSYMKRFTSLSHLYLGFAISLAPMGAWIAITGTLSLNICLLSIALMMYIAGFDILYACQDYAFDQTHGLYSMPAKLGIMPSLIISTVCHIISMVSLFYLGLVFDLGSIFFITFCIIGVLFFIEHVLVTPSQLNKIHIAFFHINSVISTLLFLGIFLDEWINQWIQ